MTNAISTFNDCLSDVRNMRFFYVHLRDHCSVPERDLADLLRSELVNTVSAMDRFLHKIVRVGIIRAYLGLTSQTLKCQAIPLRFSTLTRIIECNNISSPTSIEETAEYWINKEVVILLRSMSFQKIDKIKDALSYIWDVQYKMPMIIHKMRYAFTGTTENEKQKFLEDKIDLLVSRRNQIVHEADYDVASSSKQTIDTGWLDDTILFVKEFTYSIYENVTGDTSYVRI